MRRIKSWLSRFKKSRFFLGMVSVAIGMSLTVCFYEGDRLYQDYSEAMGYYQEYLDKKSVGAVVQAAAHDTPLAEGIVLVATPPNEESVEDKIRRIAKREEFKDANLLIRIASCESGLIPDRKSDVKTSSALGLFQILSLHQLSEEERCDVDIATTWAINHIKSGRLDAWNESKHCWNI